MCTPSSPPPKRLTKARCSRFAWDTWAWNASSIRPPRTTLASAPRSELLPRLEDDRCRRQWIIEAGEARIGPANAGQVLADHLQYGLALFSEQVQAHRRERGIEHEIIGQAIALAARQD